MIFFAFIKLHCILTSPNKREVDLIMLFLIVFCQFRCALFQNCSCKSKLADAVGVCSCADVALTDAVCPNPCKSVASESKI